MFDLVWNKFDLFVMKDCDHFKDDDDNEICEVMRSVQTISAIIFFVTIHIPLSRFNSGFCFLTALIPICLNIGTKYWFYEKANQAVCFVFRWDPEAKNIIKKPKMF